MSTTPLPFPDITPTDFPEGWWEDMLFGGAGQSLYVDEEMGAVPSGRIGEAAAEEEAGPRIDDEDFLEGPERAAFLALKAAVRAATNVNSSVPARTKAMEWLFVPDTDDTQHLTCRLCCQGLGIRESVFHARLMFQFYKNSVCPPPLPFLAVPIPSWFVGEIVYHVGDGGLTIAKVLWDQPGFRADLLRTRFAEMNIKSFDMAMDALESRGFVAIKSGCWFFTGRNPTILASLQAQRRFTWSSEMG